jgi:hypothetical protein
MSDSLTKSFDIQAKELIKQSEWFDSFLRRSLNKFWKDKTITAEICDSIQINKQTIEVLQNEIKDRNSRIA